MTSPFADASVEVIADFDRFDDQFTRKLRTSVTSGAHAAEAPLRRLEGRLGSTVKSAAQLGVTAAAAFARVLVSATALGVVTSATAALTVQTLALAGALVPIGGLVAGLPVALGIAAAGFAVMKLASAGFADVMTSLAQGDLDKFNESIKKLPPNARAFARELRELRPHLASLRADVQSRVFAGLDKQLHNLTSNLLPTLRRGLSGVAGEVNAAGRSVGRFLSTRAARNDLAAVLDSAQRAAHNLLSAVTPITRALLGAGTTGGAAIERITRAVTVAANRFAAWVEQARGSGQLSNIFDRAVTTARTFGQVLFNVGGIVRRVFSAGVASGANLLDDLSAMTARVRDFLSTSAGSSALAATFGAIRAAGEPALKLISQLADVVTQSLAQILTQLAINSGPGLSDMVAGLAQGLAALLPAAGPVGDAISAIATALGPLLAVGGQVLAAVIVPIAQLLADALPKLVPDLQALGAAIIAADFGSTSVDVSLFGDAIRFVAEHVDTLVDLLPYLLAGFIAYKASQVAANAASVLSVPLRFAEITATWAHVAALRANTAVMAQAIGFENASILSRVRSRIVTLASAAATRTASAATVVWTGVQTLFTTATNAATLASIRQRVAALASAVASKAIAVAMGIWTAAQWALNLAMSANPIGLIVIAIAALVAGFVYAYTHSETFRERLRYLGMMFVQLWDWIVAGSKEIWKWIQIAFDFTPLGMLIKHWDLVVAAFRAGVDFVVGLFSRWLDRSLAVLAWYRALPGRIWDALVGLRDRMWEALSGAWDAAVQATVDGIVDLLNWVFGIRQRMLDALADAGGWLAQVGRDIIEGLRAGIDERIAYVRDVVTKLGRSLPQWLRDMLGIKSPSTVMYEVGANAGQGFADGISQKDAAVKAAALRLKIAAQEGMSGIWEGKVWKPVSDPVQERFDAGLDYFGNAPTKAQKAATAARTQLEKDKALLIELEKIAAGKGKAIAGIGDAGTGLGGTSGTDLVSAKARAVADKAATALAAHRAAMDAAGKFLGDGLIAGLTGTAPQVKAAADKMSALLVKALGAGGASKIVASMTADSKRLRAMADERVKVTARLADAQKKLSDLVSASDKLRDSIADKVRSSFELIPQSGSTSVESLIRQMDRAVVQASAFAGNIAALKARGLSAALLEQLADAGPDKGGAMAARLAKASSSQLAQLNTMSGKLEAVAVGTGKTVSNALYASGIAAAQGLVNGLTSRKKEIEAAMLDIAKSIQTAIRAALGIKSPSTVMRGLGEQVVAGLREGILAEIPELRNTMGVVGGVVGGPLGSPTIPAQRGARPAGDRRAAGRDAPLFRDLNVMLPTGDPEAAAQSVMNRIAAKVA